MTIMPHNHLMWAVIGVYTGREDNIFWRRLPGDDARADRGGRREIAGRALRRAAGPRHHPFGDQPARPRLTGAIHVYGGDFYAVSAQRVGPGDLARTAATI